MNKPKKHLLIIEEDQDQDQNQDQNQDNNQDKEQEKDKIINKGTGAGGKNTNFHGKKFEEKTNNQPRLLEVGYIQSLINVNLEKDQIKNQRNKKQNSFCLSKIFPDITVTFVLQNGLKTYMKYKYNIDVFRCPDEAYIIEYHNSDKRVIKILEKKEQNVEGSVETKLWSGPSLKREYEILLEDINFTVHYGFCVNDFLKQKMISKEPKYTILNRILKESGIEVLFGDDDNYFETLDKWINNSL
jgi:hypothetical protein